MRTYIAQITRPEGGRFEVTIQAKTPFAAKEMLEALYGKGKVNAVRESR